MDVPERVPFLSLPHSTYKGVQLQLLFPDDMIGSQLNVCTENVTVTAGFFSVLKKQRPTSWHFIRNNMIS